MSQTTLLSRDLPSAHSDDPHFITRANWLRAAVLGANDGIVSVAALIVGVSSAMADRPAILLAGGAALAAGAMSMAAGEYVSVSSQADTERADIAREHAALQAAPEAEEAELAQIFQSRGLSASTAAQVARELTAHDALAAHIREELGLSEISAANPLQAALTSALTFSVAAALPLIAAWLAPAGAILSVVVITTLLALAMLGAIGAHTGGAPVLPGLIRVLFWGAAAMAITAGVGMLFGVSA